MYGNQIAAVVHRKFGKTFRRHIAQDNAAHWRGRVRLSLFDHIEVRVFADLEVPPALLSDVRNVRHICVDFFYKVSFHLGIKSIA